MTYSERDLVSSDILVLEEYSFLKLIGRLPDQPDFASPCSSLSVMSKVLPSSIARKLDVCSCRHTSSALQVRWLFRRQGNLETPQILRSFPRCLFRHRGRTKEPFKASMIATETLLVPP